MSYQTSKLANGLTVITEELGDRGTTAISLSFGSGMRDEPEDRNGIAHFVEHMMFKGTSRRSAERISSEMEDCGGELNAYTDTEITSYEVHVLPDNERLAIDILGDMMTSSLHPEDELRKELGVVLAEIGESMDEPSELADGAARAKAFAGHILGKTILGTSEVVSSFDRSDVIDFTAANYRGGNALLSVSGNVSHERIMELAEEHFGSLPHGVRQPRLVPEWVGGNAVVSRKEFDQAHAILYFRGRERTHQEDMALRLFAMSLGGCMSSRLYQEIREKRGLAYSVYSAHYPQSDVGTLEVSVSTQEKDLNEALDVMTDVIADTAITMTEVELARAKAQLKMQLASLFESTDERTDFIARSYLSSGRAMDLQGEQRLIEEVSLSEVRCAAAAALANRPALGAAGPVGDEILSRTFC